MFLSLNCLIHGDDQEKMFTVKVLKTDNVSILKKLIKEEKAPHLDYLAASDLHLWKVDLDLDELAENPVHVDLESYSKLSPRTRLSALFKDVHDNCLHIVAKAPGMLQQSSWNRI